MLGKARIETKQIEAGLDVKTVSYKLIRLMGNSAIALKYDC